MEPGVNDLLCGIADREGTDYTLTTMTTYSKHLPPKNLMIFLDADL